MQDIHRIKKALLLSGAKTILLFLLWLTATLVLAIGPLLAPGNKVRVEGKLRVEAYAYEGTAQTGPDLSTQRDLSADPIPIISKDDWLEGKSRVKFLEVRNKGDIPARVKLNFSITDESMAGALWYDFNRVDDSWKEMGEPSRRPMNTLEQVGDIYTYTLQPQETLRLKLEYGVSEEESASELHPEFEADAVVRAAQVIGMEQMVKVYDAVDFLDRNDHPTYVLMRSIKGDVSLSSLANIDLNGYTLDGSVRFGAEAPILAAGDLYIGSGTGGVITGRVYVDAPNAEVYHYGTADSVSIKAAAGYHFYGESKVSFWMQDGTLTIGRDALVESLSVSSKAAAPIKIVNDGVIREFEALVENAAYTPVITGNTPQVLTEGTKANLEQATGWDGEFLTEPEQRGGVYQIGSAAELAWIANEVNTNGLTQIRMCLTRSIDLNEREWTPIGRLHPFTGSLDGQGYTISRLHVTDGAQHSGLFGLVRGADIQNLTLEAATLQDVNSYSGALIGRAVSASLKNCHVRNSTVSAASASVAVGGLIGQAAEGAFRAENCSVSNTSVSGYFNLGGFIGSCLAEKNQKLLLSACRVERVSVTAAPYEGDVEAWSGKYVQTHRFIGQAQADAAGASLTLQGCSVADSTDNLSPEARIGSEELKDWMARGVGDIRIQP